MRLHFHNRFALGLLWRLVLLVGLVFLFVAAIGRPDLGAARVVAGLLVLGAAFMLWRHVQRTNLEVARFIDAVRFGDFSQGRVTKLILAFQVADAGDQPRLQPLDSRPPLNAFHGLCLGLHAGP